MNNKIKNYVDVLFSDIPRGKRANELKEELLSNMSERFDDYIAQGKTENQAYSLVISNLGDIDEMLDSVRPNAEFLQQAASFRTRNARNTAIGVSLYIVSVVFLIGFGGLGTILGDEDLYGIIGLLIMLLIAASATALIVYTHMSTPTEFKDYDEQSKRDAELYKGRDGRVFKSILSAYWSLVTLIYLGVSFLTLRWDITWLIWVLAGVFQEIMKTIFEMRQHDE